MLDLKIEIGETIEIKGVVINRINRLKYDVDGQTMSKKDMLSFVNDYKKPVVVEKDVVSIVDLRTKNYKEIARRLHPDSEFGDEDSFKVLQDIKEYLWDCNGEPRSEIFKLKWNREKMMKNGWEYQTTIKAWIKKGEKPIFTDEY